MKNSDMPIAFVDDSDVEYVDQCRPLRGLTKREYFAGLAMQGLTNSAFKYMSEGDGYATEAAMAMMRDIGKVSCDIADALLAELEKEPSQ